MLFCFFTPIISFAQSEEAYIIKNKGLIKEPGRYVKALNSADLDRYRSENDRVVLKFKSGIEVILFSYEELNNAYDKGKKIKVIDHNALFTLHKSGVILETHQIKSK